MPSKTGMEKTHEVFLGLGTNLGNRLSNLKEAARLIRRRIGPVVNRSAVYQTEPWGLKDQPEFFNQALCINTLLEPQEVLEAILAIEREMGRVRHLKWDRRLIDIDILFYDQLIFQSEHLKIPHPLLEKRNFVMAPLAEIAPALVHPVFGKTVKELLLESPDPLKATILVL